MALSHLWGMRARFLCVILPPAELAEWVVRQREVLHGMIGSFSGRNLQPHVTLFFADLDQEHEGSICEALAKGVVGQAPFDLGYHGIIHFPNRRTIYVDPMEKERIAPLRNALIRALQHLPEVASALRQTDHPHLTIAAGLKPAQFEKAWALLSPHEVQATGRVGEAVLLKRLPRPGERYVPVRAFPLVG